MTAGVIRDSFSLSQQISGRLSSGDAAQLAAGQVTAVDAAGVVTVDIGGIDQVGLLVSQEPLAVGDTVLVTKQAGTYRVVGIVFPTSRPTSGTVASIPANSSVIVVTTAIGSISCAWVAAYTPVVADAVWIVWLGSTPVVAGKQGKTGTPPTGGGTSGPSTPTPPPKTSSGLTTFPAIASGTVRGGQWMDNSVTAGNVMQGDFGSGANSGAWFYGGRVHSSLAGATVTSAQIWLGRSQGGTFAAQTVHLSRVTNNTRPAGSLTFDAGHATDSISLAVGQSGWFALPTSIAQSLVDSGGSMGVTSANPYVRLLGVGNNGSAGALRIAWRR